MGRYNWHRLSMGQESNEDGFSVEEEWNGIQELLKKVPYQMKLEMKEVLRQLAFPDTTMLSPPPRKVPTKRAMKKWILQGLEQKWHRLIETLFRGRLLIPKIRIVNNHCHQQLHHFLKGKVLVLVKYHVPHFHHQLGLQSLFRFQSLLCFQRLFRFWARLIICQSSWFHLLKKWLML